MKLLTNVTDNIVWQREKCMHGLCLPV